MKDEKEHLEIADNPFENEIEEIDEEIEVSEADPTSAVEPEDYENFEETQTIRREELQNSEAWKKTMDDLFE